tara:strand:+ start:343 stop:813 length:471 start_codon:yes stop_codon:yes gene_type:complete
MNKYIIFIIAAVFVLNGNVVQADNKTNKVATATAKAAKAKVKKGSKPKRNKASAEARKKYSEAAKKIREALKAGKLTPAQAKAKYAELRKKIAPKRSKTSQASLLKRFDKNKDGKLCDVEKAAMKKALEARKKKSAKGNRHPDGRKRHRPERREKR